MKIDIKILATAIFLVVLMISCDEAMESREPSGNDQSVPSAVSNVQVTNLPGKALFTYSVPEDKNLLFIKAEYQLPSGKSREVTASFYKDSLLVEGFIDTLEHEVKIYSVSRNNVESAPFVVTVKPLEAPVWKVFKSLEVQNTFGGFNVSANNPDEEEVSIYIMKRNAFNQFDVDNRMSVFTSEDDILAKIRGLDTLAYDFRIFVKDKWGNSTDTVAQVVEPIFETQLDPVGFRAFVLPGDAPQVPNGARLEYAWDNRLGWPWTSFTHQVNGGPEPHIITFDMGVEAKLSRLWIRAYPELNPQQFYFLTSLRKFEVWGSVSPNLSGALDESWTLLGSYEVEKPSGTSYGQDSALDREVASAGWDFEVDLDAPKIRYIRIRCLENWAGGTAQSINELRIYGDPR
ncbi:DUF5000 domain-containing lipoprotein [Algoriphagus sp. Y33]|uniref:DUF5000 domain-containing lipoprotein n=1 Tax=Algoriphagus sp. Y33 TaxID=2772483 RepID=UPI00177C70BC|nr:DUF5000 domain-containing lipoprotein [Algoriphagus sp. Y33]